MTDVRFGRAMPIHFAILMLIGWNFDTEDTHLETNDHRRREIMRRGRAELSEMTGQDYGYNLQEWREFLLLYADEYGYTHPYSFDTVDETVQEAIADTDFQRLAKSLSISNEA